MDNEFKKRVEIIASMSNDMKSKREEYPGLDFVFIASPMDGLIAVTAHCSKTFMLSTVDRLIYEIQVKTGAGYDDIVQSIMEHRKKNPEQYIIHEPVRKGN